MIRFALIAASVLGFALTAALGNLMVPLLRELQRTMRGAQPQPCSRSQSVQTRSSAGSTARRTAHSSLVSRSACCLLMRSVLDQLRPSRKGGRPVLATSCSMICRTGVSASRICPSAPMTLTDTSPTATKSRTTPFFASCIAADHSLAMVSACRSAETYSPPVPGLQTTA